jgi:rod shape-determining protein MreD
MINNVIRYSLLFIVLISVQVLLLNNIHLGGYINPFLYVALILVFPVRFPGIPLLLIAFVTGLLVDVFSNTMGMHAAATLFMAYSRPGILKLIAPREGYESEARPLIKEQGLAWFITYASIMVFFHHLVLFNLEVFRLSEFLTTLLRMILSTVATLATVLVTVYFIEKPAEKR